jgi:ribose transport system permease protein
MVTTSVYVIGGVLAAVGGVLMTSRLGAGVPTAGTGFELQAIAACVIGGASLSGARGSAIGAACGALIIGVLNNGGNLLAINVSPTDHHRRLVLVAVGFDPMNTRKKARS